MKKTIVLVALLGFLVGFGLAFANDIQLDDPNPEESNGEEAEDNQCPPSPPEEENPQVEGK